MTYLDRPVLDFRPDFQQVRHGILDDSGLEALAGCPPVIWKTTAGLRRKITLPFLLDGKDEIDQFRLFFSARAGRRTGFWLPVWLDEYRLASDITSGESTLDVGPSRLAEAETALGDQYGHLFLATPDDLAFYAIDSTTDGGTAETITLTGAVAGNWNRKRTICGGLLWVRLLEDKIDLNFLTDTVAEVTLSFLELPEEYATEHEGEWFAYLYQFARGTDVWNFTNMPVTAWDATDDPQQWGAASIQHSGLTYNSDMLPEEVTVTVITDSAEHPLRAYKDRHRTERTELTIWEINVDTGLYDADAPVFKGEVAQVDFRGKGEIQARCQSSFGLGQHTLPKVMLQRICNHRLFDAGCKLGPASWSVDGTITALAQNYVEATWDTAKANDWFALGQVKIGNERRVCTKSVGGRLYINAPFLDAEVGDAVRARAGCDKRAATCQSKFDNLANFLGFPYTPRSNPQLEPLCTPCNDMSTGGKK